MEYFLITGTSRSGTTLIDKILNSHSNLRVYSQPLPKLYRQIKKCFYNNIGIYNKYYVLDDLFFPEYYPEQFLSFLRNYQVKKNELEDVISSMEGWSGQYSKIHHIDDFISNYNKDTLDRLYKGLLNSSVDDSNDISIGTKETLIEEFIGYFLSHNVKVVLVIRDPRDVLTSLNFGKGTEYGGIHRPTLFHLRNWRKSVAIANTFKDHQNCLVLKYEDLLDDNEQMLRELTSFLNAEVFPPNHFDNGILGDNGKIWLGNSSTEEHYGINKKNKFKYRRFLSKDTIGYIDFICKPEMLAFNYPLENETFQPYKFKEPFIIGDCGLNPQMSTEKKELDKEMKRNELLNSENPDPKLVSQVFYSMENFRILKKLYE